MFRDEIENVIGTYGELKENNKKNRTPPYHPQKEKSRDPLDA
jgi:hypothetical protein